MKSTILLSVLVLALAVLRAAATPPEITNVKASQRDGTKLVDIYYDVADADGDLLTIRIEVSDNDGARYSVPAFTLSGDIGEGIEPGKNKHIVWDAGTDWDGEYSDLMRVMVFAVDAQGYPGMEWGNEVPPGGFLLGQDGGTEGSGPSRHVNIPWSYWLSKYEITVQQYCDFLNTAYAAGLVTVSNQLAVNTVMGANLIENMHGSYKLICLGDSYDIRWNVNNFEVVSNFANYPVIVTWYGAAAFAHYYGYDLPTEAEWEKAARGPDHDDQDEHQCYTWGDTLSSAYAAYGYSGRKPVGYYDGNQTPIGPDMANGYGLYDMTGNAWEWTLTAGNYGIASYPQQENLLSPRHLFWHADSICCKGGGYSTDKPFIYVREIDSLSRDYWNGFRVIRRHEAGRETSSYEIFEDFESWPEKTYGNSETVTVASGTWELSDTTYLRSDTTNAFSGSKYIYLSNGHSLHLPVISNQLVEVRMKLRYPNSNSSAYLKLESGSDATGYSSRSIHIPINSDYTTISITPARDGEKHCIYASN